MAGITEADVEKEALELLGELGYSLLAGPDIAPGGMFPERATFSEVVLVGRLRGAVHRLNPDLPGEACEEVVQKVLRRESPLLVLDNRRFHELLVDGVPVEYRGADGEVAYPRARLVAFDEPKLNDWVAVNQLTVIENGHTRRPDIVVFVNGLPLGLFELKDLGNASTTVKDAYQQLVTYRDQVPSLMQFNETLVISDHMTARMGSLTADIERFMPWRTVEGEEPPSGLMAELPVLIKGVFEKGRFLQLIRHFVVFEDDGAEVSKKLAAYHQFHAVNKAVDETVTAASATGDKRAGVVWHTQGSGKSLTMTFYAGRLIAHPAMENPTLVVLTDRNDLDDQLFGTFSRCWKLLRQTPFQAGNRGHLRELLNVASGGVVFTTIQKFLPEEKGDRYPELSPRRNIVVIADEAHRSQYDFVDGFARHIRDALPNASFIGFTGTPIELEDRSTRAIFGEYIDVYDIERAVNDGATVRIYYESRMAKIELNEVERPHLDPEFEELTEGEEEAGKQKLRTKWAAVESLVGTEKRLSLVAKDLVQHFETRLQAMEGKAMVVCMSRRICVDLYEQLVKLRPTWDSTEDAAGGIKVGDDRLGVGQGRVAEAHPPEEGARGAGESLQGPGGPVEDRDRPRHVADGL